MAKAIPIEIAGETLGVVVPTNGRFRFVAIKLRAFDYDGQVFESPAEARRVIASPQLEERALAS